MAIGQSTAEGPVVALDLRTSPNQFALAEHRRIVPIYVAPDNPETVRVAVNAFAADLESVTGAHAKVLESLPAVDIPHDQPRDLIIAGVIGNAPEIDRMIAQGKLSARSIQAVQSKWESALIAVVEQPMPGVRRALVIAGSDRRGAAFALFTLSRRMGVSPWTWWADVPVKRRQAIYIDAKEWIQHEPSIPYRGIFLNDEDWGLRPWAAKKMDPEVHNLGPHTYARVFELLLRLRANTLWPAMHPGTLAFNALPENAKLADQWGIVMGSSHSEALLRNNVGEWDEKRDGPWNYQLNKQAIDTYWEKRVQENGHYENFYTVGMRGVHDTGLEATGTAEEKARLVESAMTDQRNLLREYVKEDVQAIPQVIWLYKESLDLYRAGMKVPGDVTLGWTDDNYGYLRQLPNADEQKRPGGSGVYYHVSYWGFPHDYLWLCTTPPALIREEMTKAYDHHARRYWILNVGDLKPAEPDIDYFLQLAWDEPGTASMTQHQFLQAWYAEQFPPRFARTIANVMQQYYRLNFVRKPEFMGFNGYDDGIHRTDFNPLAWGDQNRIRDQAWKQLSQQTSVIEKDLPPAYADAFFELAAYPVQAAAAQNEKFLAADRSFLDRSQNHPNQAHFDSERSHAAYNRIQTLTQRYNSIASGKWSGMMSSTPRDRQVFKMPQVADDGQPGLPLPTSWREPSGVDATKHLSHSSDNNAPFAEKNGTVSINAVHFARKWDGTIAAWQVLPELGISGGSVEYGSPGLIANTTKHETMPVQDTPWLDYEIETQSTGDAILTIDLLPTFPIDSEHRMRFEVKIDGGNPIELDSSGLGEWKENAAPTWSANVLRNFAEVQLPLGRLSPGLHTVRLMYRDPSVVFEHLAIIFPDSTPAYPVAPETRARRDRKPTN
jgi:hypothetical protein